MDDHYNVINEIIDRAEKEKLPYPKLFQALMDAGVTSYEVQVDNYHAQYYGSFGTWVKPVPKDFVSSIVNPHCDKNLFLQALERRIKKETTYVEYLAEIAAAGIAFYRVDMATRTATYFAADSSICHVQNIPKMS